MKNPMMANALVQTLIKSNVADVRTSFLAGAAWAFEQIDREYPELDLQKQVPILLQRLAAPPSLDEPAPEPPAPPEPAQAEELAGE